MLNKISFQSVHCNKALYVTPNAPLALNVRMIKAEVMEALYGCMAWTLRDAHFPALSRTTHHDLLLVLRLIWFRGKKRKDRKLPYRVGYDRKRRETVETTIRTRRLLFCRRFIIVCMNDGQLSKRAMFGELADGRAWGRGRPEKDWVRRLDARGKPSGYPD